MDGFREQGITVCENDVLISAYDVSDNRNFSRIYIYDKYKGLYKGYIVLDSKAHVGGLSYDDINGLLFVTGANGIVNCYDYRKLRVTINEFEVIKKDGKKMVRTTNVETMKTDRQVQGLAVTDYKGEQLLFTVSSVGFTNSSINVYKYDNKEDNSKYRGTDYYRKNMEGIYISEIGQLYASFEYGDQRIECISIDDMLAYIKDNNFVQKIVEDNIALLNGVLYSYGRKR